MRTSTHAVFVTHEGNLRRVQVENEEVLMLAREPWGIYAGIIVWG